MKRWLTVAAAVILCLALVIGIACGGEEEEEEGVKTLKFGIGIPLSGAAGAAGGIPVINVFELAEEKQVEFTVGGDRYVWDFVCEDSMPGGVVARPAGMLRPPSSSMSMV